MPQGASQYELDLAQSQTEAFVSGIEVGIFAVEPYTLAERGRVTAEDAMNAQITLMRGISVDGCKLQPRTFDTDEANRAVSLGMSVGAIDLLHRKARI